MTDKEILEMAEELVEALDYDLYKEMIEGGSGEFEGLVLIIKKHLGMAKKGS